MKKTLTILVVLALAGCASTQTYKAPTQNYRLKGEEKSVQINGALKTERQLVGVDSYVGVFFNEMPYIQVKLDRFGNGEAKGNPFNGKETSATCNGKPAGNGLTQVDCMVFVDNERTVTLTF
jgi:hypothetical protein